MSGGRCLEDSAPEAVGATMAALKVFGPNRERESVTPCYVVFNCNLTVVGMGYSADRIALTLASSQIMLKREGGSRTFPCITRWSCQENEYKLN